MKNFVILTGPQAVGKMAVGLALQDKANYRLFHNHMSIEFVKELYGGLNREQWDLVEKMRSTVFDHVSQLDINFTFTFMWGYNLESDHQYIASLIELFEAKEWQVFIVELEASVHVRLERNVTPLRLKNKASKRDTEWSNNDLVKSMDKYRLNSEDGEIKHPYYLRVNNEKKTPEMVADEILEYIEKVEG